MQLLRMADVPITDRDLVFRLSPARAVALAVILAASAGALAWHAWRSNQGLLYYLAGLAGVGLMLLWRPMLARFRPTNWLVRLVDHGVYLHFRSHLNHHLPCDDLTVAFIGFNEIRAARKVLERREMIDRDADRPSRPRVTEQRRWLVELELSADTEELRSALAANLARRAPGERTWYGTSSVLFRHYPARLSSPGRLEIDWRAACGPDRFLDALRPRVFIGETATVEKPLVEAKASSREQQETHLLELLEAGQKIEAIALARRLYGYDLERAKSFVEELTRNRRTA